MYAGRKRPWSSLLCYRCLVGIAPLGYFTIYRGVALLRLTGIASLLPSTGSNADRLPYGRGSDRSAHRCGIAGFAVISPSAIVIFTQPTSAVLR